MTDGGGTDGEALGDQDLDGDSLGLADLDSLGLPLGDLLGLLLGDLLGLRDLLGLTLALGLGLMEAEGLALGDLLRLRLKEKEATIMSSILNSNS